VDEAYEAQKLDEKSHAADSIARWTKETVLLKTRIKYIEENCSAIGNELYDRIDGVRILLEQYQGLVVGHLEENTGEAKVLDTLIKLNSDSRELMREI
jgi:hypothetical protein